MPQRNRNQRKAKKNKQWKRKSKKFFERRSMEEVKRKREMGYNVEQIITDKIREAQEPERYNDIVTSRYNCRYLKITVACLSQYLSRRWAQNCKKLQGFDVATKKKRIKMCRKCQVVKEDLEHRIHGYCEDKRRMGK